MTPFRLLIQIFAFVLFSAFGANAALPVKSLAVIGSGDDPLSKAVANGTQAAVQLAASKFPEQTAAVPGAPFDPVGSDRRSQAFICPHNLDRPRFAPVGSCASVLQTVGDGIDATITFVDDATGNIVSKQWSELPERTRNQIKGGVKIISIALPGTSVTAIAKIKKAGKLPKPGKGVASTGLNQGLKTNVPTSGRKFNQLTSRGWNQSSIDDVVRNSVHQSSTVNRANGNPATAYFRSDGHYVVRDNVTGDLVQMSDTNLRVGTRPEDWKVDDAITDPYIPGN